MITRKKLIDVIGLRTSQTTIDSTWEGRYLLASAVMDRLMRSYLN